MTLTMHTTPAAAIERATVADAMHHGVISCPPSTTPAALARTMSENRVHCVVVSGLARGRRGAEELVWGIVSDLDLMNALQDGGGLDARGLALTAPLTVDEFDPLDRAVQLMAENATAHLVVVDRNGSPVGILSTLDIARVVAEGDR